MSDPQPAADTREPPQRTALQGTPLLETVDLTKQFGGLTAVNDVSFAVPERSILIIGPNGAGKTTFFNMLTGIYTPTQGTLTFKEKSVGGLKPHVITRLGITRTFQNIRLFQNMTALENVMVGRHTRTKASALGAVLRPKLQGRRGQDDGPRLRLAEVRRVSARRRTNSPRTCPTVTSGASRSRGRSQPSPQLLLLDEPAAGMNPQESQAAQRSWCARCATSSTSRSS